MNHLIATSWCRKPADALSFTDLHFTAHSDFLITDRSFCLLSRTSHARHHRHLICQRDDFINGAVRLRAAAQCSLVQLVKPCVKLALAPL